MRLLCNNSNENVCAGGTRANRIACWNGSGWSPLGAGLDEVPYALASSGGDLYAGGAFGIARWDGSSWSSLDDGPNGPILALAASGDELYVGGSFSQAGGEPAGSIARWDGSTWHAVGSGAGAEPGVAQSLAVHVLALQEGELYAAGQFGTFGGIPVGNVVGPGKPYVYDVGADEWRAWDVPVGARPGAGAAMASDDGGHVYVLPGGGRADLYRYTIASDEWDKLAPLPQRAGKGGALAWADGALYALPGGDGYAFYRYDPDLDHWAQLADAPRSIDSGVAMVPDNDTDPRFLYVIGFSENTNIMMRYDLESKEWASGLDVPAGVRVQGSGLAYKDGYLYLYAWPTQGNDNFFRYGELAPSATKLAIEGTAFVAPGGGASPSWSNLDPGSAPPDFGIALAADNAWVSNGTWGPDDGTQVDLDAAAFLDPWRGAYRVGAGSALSAGYYACRPDAYVYPSREACDRCGTGGSLAWGETAFDSIQVAVDSGATRVLVGPGVYPAPFYLVSGIEVLGAGAELSIIEAPAGASGPLVRGEGIAVATVANLTLAGNGATTGFYLEDGAQGILLTRDIVRGHGTGISVAGASLQVRNNTVVKNGNGLQATGCGMVNVRNTIFAYNHDSGFGYEAACVPSHTYNDYWANGDEDDIVVDGGAVTPTLGLGELFLDPLFASPLADNYRLSAWSPAIDAGDPSDPSPPGTGEVVDIGYREYGRASAYADDDYGPNGLNDGLTWGVDAFDTIADALAAAAGEIAVLARASGEGSLVLSVGVGPGTYAERVSVPSHVRLIGSGADVITIDAGGAGSAVTFDGVVHAEVTGFTLTGGDAGVSVRDASNAISIARNVIHGNTDGIRFEGRSSGSIFFNTIADNGGAGLLVTGNHTWVVAESNILTSNAYGLRGTDGGLIRNDYNLIAGNAQDLDGPAAGPHTVSESPAFGVGYSLSAASPAVDGASPYAPVPTGGGSQADIGYKELLASPLTLLFGAEIASTVTGNSGVAQVQVGVQWVGDLGAPVTGTLPADWDIATLLRPGAPVSRWTYRMTPDSEGLHRIYSQGWDAAGNRETDETVWYAGAIVGDATPPGVSWVWPVEDVTVQAAAVELRARAADYVEDGRGLRFNVDQVSFDVDGHSFVAQWVDEENWDPGSGEPRAFRAWVPLGVGVHIARAVAVDGAGNRTESPVRTVAVGASGHVATVTSHSQGQAVNDLALTLAGHVRFDTAVGEGQVTVQVGSGPIVSATLADPSATTSAWWATVTLPATDGDQVLTITPIRGTSGTPKELMLILDRVPPETLHVHSPLPGDYVTRTVAFEAEATDAGSGLAAVQVSMDGGYTWRAAAFSAGRWRITWEQPQWQDFVSYPAVVRALDLAGNERRVALPVTIDSLPPTGLAPVTFSHEQGSYLEKKADLNVTWTPAEDASGEAAVLLAVDQTADAQPTVVISGTSYTATLDAKGAWYVHLAARDAAGNEFLRHYGPWYVRDSNNPNFADRYRAIQVDGYLDLAHEEWVAVSELLDDDERPKRQTLFVSWDGEAFYLGWQGAWWTLDGVLWAYLDLGPAGSALPVQTIPGLDVLPFGANAAVQVDSCDVGTLWLWDGTSWTPNALEFAHGSNGDTEVRVPWPVPSVGAASLIAFAVDEAGVPWCLFPTTNPVGEGVPPTLASGVRALQASPGLEPYRWDDVTELGVEPSANQPQARSVELTMNSPQASDAHQAPEGTLQYRVAIGNREAVEMTGLQLQLEASAGLGYYGYIPADAVTCRICPDGGATWTLDLPALDPGQTHVLTISAHLASAQPLTDIQAVTSHVTLSAENVRLVGERLRASVSHRVDAQPPSAEVDALPGAAIGIGQRTFRGSADDGDGVGVSTVYVRAAGGAWQPVTGTLAWSANLWVPDNQTTFEVEAYTVDGHGNESLVVSRVFNIDTVPPEVTFDVPPLVTQLLVPLRGTARDPAPPEAQVARVEIQVDEEGFWQVAEGPYEPANGQQSWHLVWEAPREDVVAHQLRARAFDAVGNVTLTDWFPTTVDNVSPAVTVTHALTEVRVLDYYGLPSAPEPLPVLEGSATDNGGVQRIEVLIYTPDGRAYREGVQRDGDGWRYVPQLGTTVTGRYALRVEATDSNGNLAVYGPHYLSVVDNPIEGLGVVNDSPTMLTYATTFTATVVDGSNITYTWDFGDGSPPLVTDVDPLGTGSVVSHTYPAVGTYTAVVTARNSATTLVATAEAIVVDIPVAYPLLVEGFEGAFPPAGWAVYSLSGDQGGWQQSAARAHGGKHSAFHDDALAGQDSWLVTPQVVPSLGSRLTFWQYEPDAAGYGGHSIWVSAGSPDPSDGDYVELVALEPGAEVLWEPIEVALGLYAVQPVHIAFRYEGGYADEWYVDDVVVTADLVALNDGPTPLGLPTTLTADVGSGTNIVYAWDLGDGTLAEGRVVMHTYPSVGFYTATVTATNPFNAATATTSVQVYNVDPDVDATGHDQVTFEDEPIRIEYVPFSDPNRPDSHTATIDWGDGTITDPAELEESDTSGGVSGFHVYAEPGVYTVTVTVRDAYGGSGSDSLEVAVIHGFLRYCTYADEAQSGVTVYSGATLDCQWVPAGYPGEFSASGVGSRYRIDVRESAVITGNLLSLNERIVLDREVQILGDMVSREYGLDLRGDVTAEGDVILKERCLVAGNVTSRSDVQLGAESTVWGDVSAVGQVQLDGTVTVSGTVTESADIPPIPDIASVAFTVAAGGQDLSLDKDAVLALDPGSYSKLKVKEGATLQLRAGSYAFEAIKVEQDARIEFDLADGPVVVDVVKTVECAENVEMAITSEVGDAAGILFRITGNVVDLKEGGTYLGTYLAPNASAQLAAEATLTGALYGSKVDIKRGAKIVGMPARNVFGSVFVDPDLAYIPGMGIPWWKGVPVRPAPYLVYLPHIAK